MRADQLRDVEAHESLWALIPNPTVKLDPRGDTLENPEAHWDVFISHAAEARAIWLGLVLWTRETVSWTWVLFNLSVSATCDAQNTNLGRSLRHTGLTPASKMGLGGTQQCRNVTSHSPVGQTFFGPVHPRKDGDDFSSVPAGKPVLGVFRRLDCAQPSEIKR